MSSAEELVSVVIVDISLPLSHQWKTIYDCASCEWIVSVAPAKRMQPGTVTGQCQAVLFQYTMLSINHIHMYTHDIHLGSPFEAVSALSLGGSNASTACWAPPGPGWRDRQVTTGDKTRPTTMAFQLLGEFTWGRHIWDDYLWLSQ